MIRTTSTLLLAAGLAAALGMNVFIIKGIAREVPLEQIYVGVLPFVVAQFVLIAILVAFPQIALWLPGTMG